MVRDCADWYTGRNGWRYRVKLQVERPADGWHSCGLNLVKTNKFDRAFRRYQRFRWIQGNRWSFAWTELRVLIVLNDEALVRKQTHTTEPRGSEIWIAFRPNQE